MWFPLPFPRAGLQTHPVLLHLTEPGRQAVVPKVERWRLYFKLRSYIWIFVFWIILPESSVDNWFQKTGWRSQEERWRLLQEASWDRTQYSTSLKLADARWSLCCVAVQSLSRVQLFAIPWTAACRPPLSITNSWSLLKQAPTHGHWVGDAIQPSHTLSSPSLLKFMSIDSVMLSNHLILHHPLLLLPSVFPSIRVFSRESVLRIRWQSIGASASASVLPMNIQGCFPLGVTAQDLHTHNWGSC